MLNILIILLFLFAVFNIVLLILILKKQKVPSQEPQQNQFLQQIVSDLSITKEKLLLMEKNIQNQISEIQLKVIEKVYDVLSKTTQSLTQSIGQSSQFLKDGVQGVTQQMDKRLCDMTAQLAKRLEDTAKIFSELQKGIASVQEKATDFTSVGKELRDILLPSGDRGYFGDIQVEKILSDVFPKEVVDFHFSVEPGSSELVDAGVKIDGKWLPIDSKFPVADFLNYKRSESSEKVKYKKLFIKKVIELMDSIEKKYIRPPYTHEIAIMYIPSESIYQEAITQTIDNENDDLFSLSRRKKILISSPQTLHMYLRLLTVATKTQKVQENVSILLQQLSMLQISLESVKKVFSVAKSQLNYASKNLGEAEGELLKFEQRLSQIISLPGGITDQKVLKDSQNI